MERKKHTLIVLLISISYVAFAQNEYQKRIYEAFVLDNMNEWKMAIDEMENKNPENPKTLAEIINYEYGYIGWCLGNDEKKQAKHYLELMKTNLERYKNTTGPDALYHAYMAAATGYKIGLSNWRAPFLGPQSMNHAEKAIKRDSLSFQANVELGNIWNHMPAVFGGSPEKASRYYKKAMEIYEERDTKEHKKWLYLNIVAITGKLEYEAENYNEALELYKKALNFEPRFKWVKNELLPELIKRKN